MFAYNAENVPAINNHASALAVWQKAKPWRNAPSNERPLEDRKKRHVAIVLHPDRIACRLHSTEVVSYYEDGRVAVYLYGSVSTDNFVCALLRHCGTFIMGNKVDPVVWRRDVGTWDLGFGQLVEGRTAWFDENYNLQNPRLITTYALHNGVSRKLRDEYGYSEFTAWRKAYEAMHGQPDFGWRSRGTPKYRPDAMAHDWVIDALKQRGEVWKELSRSCSDEFILKCIYHRHPEVVATAQRESFNTLRDYENWRALDRKYGHLVR